MNDRMEKKRIRGSNFTPEEELELIQNILNYQHIIESKELNASTRNEKDAAWNQISQIFNAKFSPRTTHQLRSKYDNMKTIARRLISEKRNNVINYNGYNIRSNIAMDIVLSIVSGKYDNPSENVINCNPEDIQFSEESSSYSDNSTKHNISINANDNHSYNDFDLRVKSEDEDNYSIERRINNLPINLQIKPTTKTLIINTPAEINRTLEKNHINISRTLEKNDINISRTLEKNSSITIAPIPKPAQNVTAPQNSEVEEKTSDSTNNSNNNKSVSPKKRNPRLQELLRVKTEYLKRKTQLIELENEERIKRMRREEELYAMRMKIMMLDYNIKEEELRKLRNINK